MHPGIPPPGLQTSLSLAAPDKAAEIRSRVTGALRYSQNGFFSFERSVETTFVLPWDLNPRVDPQRLSLEVREVSRNTLLDENALLELESFGAINWNNSVQWQYRAVEGGPWQAVKSSVANELEKGYHSIHCKWEFSDFPDSYQVDFPEGKLLIYIEQRLFDLRRLAFALLMPMKTEEDNISLFHAASLGFWGVHDRTSLLNDAVTLSLTDPQARVVLHDRWCQWITRMYPGDARQIVLQWDAAKKNVALGGPQLHLFTLSNVVQRPIVVYTHPESNVGGIYLPLLWETDLGVFPCDSIPHLRNPLILGYNVSRNHYTPLVTFKGVKGPNPILLPLTTAQGTLLPIHFLTPAQATRDPTTILSRLMNIEYMPMSFGQTSQAGGQNTPAIITCVLNISDLPAEIDELVRRYQSRFL